MRRTRTNILATLGPASSNKEVLSKLIDAGADAFRFNFSHGTHRDHKKNYNIVRRLEKEKGMHISVVADLQGPKLRIGDFKDSKILLKVGNKFELTLDKVSGDETRVTLPHPEIFKSIKVGDELLLNDGSVVLKVKECDRKHAITEVKYGGYLSNHKGINLPNIRLPISAITEKDEKDLKFALKMGADWVAISFVQSADDVRAARKLIGDKAWIITKLEKPSAVEDLDAIIDESDAVMVARGDLGVECPIQTVPVLQKKIVSACRKKGKPVIVATQMLESMINAPSPTRAEASDVATAVYDGADAVMLSAETAVGQYPVETVQMMNNIITQVEADPLFFRIMEKTRTLPCCAGEADSITFAATEVLKVLNNVAAIVTYTSSGYTTLLTARERPRLPIMAITPDVKIARRLSLVWGVNSYINKVTFRSFNRVESMAIKIAKEKGFAKSGQHIIITAGFPLNTHGRTNMLHTVYVP